MNEYITNNLNNFQPSQQEIDNIIFLQNSSEVKKFLEQSLELVTKYSKSIFAYKILGIAYYKNGDLQKAISALHNAAELDITDTEAVHLLGNYLLEDNSYDDAEKVFKQLTILQPLVANSYFLLAYAQYKNNKNLEIDVFENLSFALCLDENHIEANKFLYAVFNNNIEYYKNKIKQRQNSSEIKVKILLEQAENFKQKPHFYKALQLVKQAESLEPNNIKVLTELCSLYLRNCQPENAQKIADKTIKVEPENLEGYFLKITHDIHCNRDINDAKQTAQMFFNKVKNNYQTKYKIIDTYKNFHEKLKINYRNNKAKNRPIKRLKIGFISGDFYSGPVCSFLYGFLQNMKKINANFDFYAYSIATKLDDAKNVLVPLFRKYSNVKTLTDAELANFIFNDKIHILFDLAGCTKQHRLLTFPLKPAPIQITWIDWVSTTGIPEMDYIIADEFCVPNDKKYEEQFTEKVIRFPHIWEVFAPPVKNLVNAKNSISNQQNSSKIFTFGNFNRSDKVNSNTINLWSKILLELPNTRLIWLRDFFKEIEFKNYILNIFKQYGISEPQIQLLPYTTYENYLQTYQDIDLILDTFPVSGMTTTAEALTMGVPTLTLVGDLMPSRLSGSCLKAVGDLDELICYSETEYINKAIFYANNPQKLNKLKNGLAEKARKSPLCDAELFAKNFEIKMWEVWNNFLDSE